MAQCAVCSNRSSFCSRSSSCSRRGCGSICAHSSRGWSAWSAWDRLKARLAAAIEHLPPYPTLLVFLIPVVLLFPLKLLGLWMLAHGSWLGAMTVLALAKVVSMGVTAFIFDLTRPKLLQLGWFRWFYEHMLVWLAKAHALVDPIKAAVKRRMRKMFWLMKPGRPGRFFRRIARIRRRMQAPQPAE